ncbi:hypothetical protein [Paraburkholderia adhaesiva]|uniref:hypothetical protein n=1 Tax=Paraburkholderia adhaesiva TaxID=2883244 RepID=UPI001F48C53B|nr:hypothetical protein [Paraburkholderia adhaesiva]
MIAFENDDCTRGEQLVLRALMEGFPLARSSLAHLDAADFSHDLHGRIFRHALRLAEQHIAPGPGAVYASMREARRGRGLDGVAAYLLWLTGDACRDLPEPFAAIEAFRRASLERHAPRAPESGRERVRCRAAPAACGTRGTSRRAVRDSRPAVQ